MHRPDEIASRLREIPFFQYLTGSQVEEIQSVSHMRDYDEGDLIFEEGQEGDTIFFVLRGSVSVRKRIEGGREEELARLGMNATFGEIAFLLETPRTASVRAEEPTTLLELHRREFQILLNADSLAAYKLSHNMVQILAARLRRMDEWLVKILKEAQGSSAEDLAEILRTRGPDREETS